MPRASLRPCAAPGCPALVERGRCPKHKAQQDARNREQHRDYNTRRPASDRFYGTVAWKALRALHLRENPLCVTCAEQGRVRLAVIVDHITPRKERPELSMVPSNLRSLCRTCHNVHGRRVAAESGPGAG